jgi:hypothetical protein
VRTQGDQRNRREAQPARHSCSSPLRDTRGTKALVSGQDGITIHVFQDDFELLDQEERLGGFLRQRIKPLLHFENLVGVNSSKVVLLGWIFREIVNVDTGRKHIAPDQLPIILSKSRPGCR